MSKYTVRLYTKNGDKLELETDSLEEVQKLEKSAWEPDSNIGTARIDVNE